ncbi:N-acetylglucosamine-6-phosphate deacetylase [Candidatus Formimonas warabiya]|uniref:N-acetylglucosamine-6-phosphate deacetylase n=1 Tax=Formimonas warabiya TaxID=1761012 RepID=A0A3G1KXR6_FORW1|nr:N-acetylglucosamine-6-phosphate deacetylase [Candidatus Formimonas warabiya]ATW27232.1 N-acetylglucosamine-6-phosphate deacetylase [Candidatus Formimonas warabiya]
MRLVIGNVSLVLPGEVISGQEIVIEDGLMMDYGCTGKFSGVKWDGEGGFLLPGLLDLHVHGAMGYHFSDGAGWEKILAHHLKGGTTGLLATTLSGRPDEWQAAAHTAKAGRENLPDILGIHMEGPLINPQNAGIHQGHRLGRELLPEVKKFIEENHPLVKLITLAPELPGMDLFIPWLEEKKIVVSVGHSQADLSAFEDHIRSCLTRATHIFNAMAPFHHRNPGVAGACLLNPKITVEAIADGIHLHPDTVRLVFALKGYDKMSLVTDAVALSGLPENSRGKMGHQEVRLAGNGVYDREGNLAGTNLTMMEAVKNTVQYTGCPLWQAVYMASVNPAKTLGIFHRVGSIDRGKQADLVLIDKSFQVKKVWMKGQLVFSN